MRYPKLSVQQQLALPELIDAKPIAAMFEDSTHQLWQCQTKDGQMMLKVCNQSNVSSSSFWQGAAELFDYNLADDLGLINHIYQTIKDSSSLVVPKHISSASVDENNQQEGYILTEFVEGDLLDKTGITLPLIDDLAEYISCLHRDTRSHWGSFHAAHFTAAEWPSRLQISIRNLAQHPDNKALVSDAIVTNVLAQISDCQPQQFVPIMLDLRWDQFLIQQGKLSALIDLDAFVIGPKELDLVLLEYLLTESECQVFKQHYALKHGFPDLSKVREVYRLLLFLMNVLGEENINSWMNSPAWFDHC